MDSAKTVFGQQYFDMIASNSGMQHIPNIGAPTKISRRSRRDGPMFSSLNSNVRWNVVSEPSTLKKSTFFLGVHVVIHGKDQVPFAQEIHVEMFVPPGETEKELGGHDKQVVDPALVAYVPAGHWRQAFPAAPFSAV
jgi:hypothetical protein